MNRGMSVVGHRNLEYVGTREQLDLHARRRGALIGGMSWWAAVRDGVSRQLRGDQINGEKGYRQNNEGKGADPNAALKSKEECTETERTWMDRHCRSFPATWQLTESQKEKIIKAILEQYISSPESSTDANWDADAKEYPALPGTHRCLLCHRVFDLLSQARRHLLTAEKDHGHLRAINRDIRIERKRLSGNIVTGIKGQRAQS
jgi:hypothetical protein